jgi:D-threonate/D-erythronate kinase
MTVVRIVADDLTGALDAAAPLVGVAGPLPVLWDESLARTARRSLALDSESRDREVPAASLLAALRGAELAFKKIDSLLRGRTIDEIAACLTGGGFASAVIAPAFPAQQRITRGGRQYWRPSATAAWQPVEVDLIAALRGHGLPVRHAPSAERIAGRGFFLCDATAEEDLGAIARAGRALPGPRLWIGTAGLARALAGPAAPTRPAPLRGPLLMVIGSHHPVTLAQVGQLAAHASSDAILSIRLDRPDPAAAVELLAATLAAHGRAAVVFALPDGTGADVAGPLFDRVMALAVERLAPPPGCLVVTGGATLFRLARALDADALLVTGELMPGIAVSRLEGGRWPGATVLSKSGAFGAPDLLVRWWDLVQPREGSS